MFGNKKKDKKQASLKKQETHISAAIKDLNRELKVLSRRKSEFEKDLGANQSKIIRLKTKEKKLQNSMLKLIQKRDKINEKRRGIFSKIKRIKNKMSQVNRIKEKIKSI